MCLERFELFIHSKTLGAKLHSFVRTANQNPRLMKIGLKSPFGSSFGVRHIVTIHDAFTAIFAFLSHRNI